MNKKEILLIAAILLLPVFLNAQGYELVWNDEFEHNDTPDPASWSFEEGFARNHELQWYQDNNAYCKDGLLVIEARREKRENPLYEAGSNQWRKSRRHIEYTSSSISTAGKQPHYLLLNLAIGGDNGGEPDVNAFPMKYEIDYVRVYQKKKGICSGEIWPDDKDVHINAHGGGVLYHNGKYYWFGEHKSEKTSAALVGVTCYSSTDLIHWKNEGVALSVSDDPNSDIVRGSVIERPKVIYNEKTGKFVMWFHLELKGQGYAAARAGLAVSDTPTGPYTYIRSGRVNPGIYPTNMTKKEQETTFDQKLFDKWWTPEWYDAVNKGLFVKRDLEGGQMSRDMTLFVDDDKKAYHIYSSEENLTLNIAELTDNYQGHTGKYIRIAPAGHNEAPAIFKKEGTYWMITSGCTGWKPNEARMFSAPSIWGPWTQHPNPCRGENAELTFGGQSTYILTLPGETENKYIFMADIWRPKHPIDARYIWLPIQFDNDGIPFVEWINEWKP